MNMTTNKIDNLLELTLKQSEYTVAIIDLFIDYNKNLKEIIEQLSSKDTIE